MSSALILFVLLAALAVAGGLLLVAEGRRPVSMGLAYLGIGLAVSGIMLLGGGIFAALFQFVLSMAAALGLVFFGILLQGRGEEAFELPPPGRLFGKVLGALAGAGSVVLLALVLPAAGTGQAQSPAASDPVSLGVTLFGPAGLPLAALGLIALVATVGSLALVFGRGSE